MNPAPFGDLPPLPERLARTGTVTENPARVTVTPTHQAGNQQGRGLVNHPDNCEHDWTLDSRIRVEGAAVACVYRCRLCEATDVAAVAHNRGR